MRLSCVVLVCSVCSGCFLFKSQPSSTSPGPTSSAGDPDAALGVAPVGDATSSPPTTDPGAAPTPPPGPVSVTLRNSCKENVRVFFGDKPKFGSGRTSSMSSNSSTSQSFQPGDMFWIVDASDNGVASVTVAEGMREIEIVDGCTSLRTH